MRLMLRKRRLEVAPEVHNLLVLAAEEARGLGHGFIGTEHVLLACLADVGAQPARALRELGVTSADVRAEIIEIVGLGTPNGSRIDRAALASIGIGLNEVRRAIKDRFGAGALERTCAGRPSVTRRAKKAFDDARRAADPFAAAAEDVLLAIVRDGESLAAQVLHRRGIAAREVEQALARVHGEAA